MKNTLFHLFFQGRTKCDFRSLVIANMIPSMFTSEEH